MRFVATTLISLAVLVGGLGWWALAATPPAVFDVVLDRSRPKPQGGYYVTAIDEPAHFNLFTSNDPVARSLVLKYTHDNLMHTDSQTGELLPALAEIVSQSGDGKTVEFRLRDGAVFSDERPVTMADVRFTYDVVQDENVTVGIILGSVARIESFEELDDRRFRVVLNYHFMGLAGMATGYPVVQKAWFMQQIAERARTLGRPVPKGPGAPGFGELLSALQLSGPGTGPYKIAAWNKGRNLTMVQNPRSWHREAYSDQWNLAGMRLRFMRDEQAIQAEFRAERVDWLMSFPVSWLKPTPGQEKTFRVLKYDSLKTAHYFIIWNHAQGRPTADPNVRLALTKLFDRERIVKQVLDDNGTVAVSWFKPGTENYPPASMTPHPFSVQSAIRLLAEAGYGPQNRLEIEILAYLDNAQQRMILELATPKFEEAHVKLMPRPMVDAAVLDRIEKGDFDGILRLWFHEPLGIDPYDFFHSNPTGKTGGHNVMRYRNSEVDEILTQARLEPDAKERTYLYQQFNQIFHDEQPVTLLAHPLNTLLLHKRFRNFEPGPSGVVPNRFFVELSDQLHHFAQVIEKR